MKIGIVQGRLLPPVNNFIQQFPGENWRKEFSLLPKLGLTHIEWLVTQDYFKNNPLFTEDISGLPIAAFGLDIMINAAIDNRDFFKEHMSPICEAVLRNGYNKLSLPLLENSTLQDENKRRRVVNNLYRLLEEYPDIRVSIEVDLINPEEVWGLLKDDRVFLTYDVGNLTAEVPPKSRAAFPSKDSPEMTSCWEEHRRFLALLYPEGVIDCIHLKDKTYAGVSVPPGEGDSPFEEIFTWLSKRDLSNVVFTLQTARKESNQEAETIKEHMHYFKELYEKELV